MKQELKKFKQLTLAIHCTDNSFGFGFREGNNNSTDKYFIKKFEKDLCNNLIFDLKNFMEGINYRNIDQISVSIGPANFNASRQIVVLARTLSQQINCSLSSHSSFELMAKRIAFQNKINTNKESFWIFKKLKNRGYIAGKYEIFISEKNPKNISIKEKVIPKIFPELININSSFESQFNEIEDIKELLNLSNENCQISNVNSWTKVLPLYPLSPIN